MKMLHVTIQTNRFDDEVNFYQEIIGLKMIRDMRPMGRNMVFLANAEGETAIEIIEAADASDAGNKYLSIGFKTDDVFAKREELTGKGIPATPMISPMPQVNFFFVTDPAGVRIQFM
jgi:lactoylglutathione lyase